MRANENRPKVKSRNAADESDLQTVMSEEAQQLLKKQKLQSSILSNFKEYDPLNQRFSEDESWNDLGKQIQKQISQVGNANGLNQIPQMNYETITHFSQPSSLKSLQAQL